MTDSPTEQESESIWSRAEKYLDFKNLKDVSQQGILNYINEELRTADTVERKKGNLKNLANTTAPQYWSEKENIKSEIIKKSDLVEKQSVPVHGAKGKEKTVFRYKKGAMIDGKSIAGRFTKKDYFRG